MQSKKTLIVAQILISGMMAGMMSGVIGFIRSGFRPLPLDVWAISFATAWPIAFVLSLLVGPLAFKLASILTGENKSLQK